MQDHAEDEKSATTWQMVLKSAQVKQFQDLDANGETAFSPGPIKHIHAINQNLFSPHAMPSRVLSKAQYQVHMQCMGVQQP